MAAPTSISELSLDLKSSIEAVLGQKHFNLPTSRCKQMQEFGRKLLDACETSERAVLHFTEEMDKELDAILKSCDTCKLLSTKREKA